MRLVRHQRLSPRLAFFKESRSGKAFERTVRRSLSGVTRSLTDNTSQAAIF